MNADEHQSWVGVHLWRSVPPGRIVAVPVSIPLLLRLREPDGCTGTDLAMAAHLFVLPAAGWASDRLARRPVLMVGLGAFALLAYPLMSLMAGGQTRGLAIGWVGLALLLAIPGGVLPATMAELAPWRVRCTVLSVAYNIGMALLGGTTPLVAAWLVARTGVMLAPALYLAVAVGTAFIGALLLPGTARHSLTKEFQSARFRRT